MNKPTGDFFYDPWEVLPEYKGTAIEDLLKQLPDHGEARVIVMAPGKSYSVHADVDDRYHVTLDAEQSFLHDIENEIPDVNFSVSDLLSKSLAKSLAIKNGKKLERQEQEYIVNTLFFCKEPAVSPSNKSIFITIKVDELDKKFN